MNDELEIRVKRYESQIDDALRYVNWCCAHKGEVDPVAALWKIRLLLLGGELVMDVVDTPETRTLTRADGI